MSQFDTPEFKNLRREYYDKLKEEGFLDIEDHRGYIKNHRSSYDFHQRIGFQCTLFRDQIFDYYSWAYHHAVHTRFATPVEGILWAAHSEGKSSREIAKLIDYDQSWVCRKIKEIRKYLKTIPESSE